MGASLGGFIGFTHFQWDTNDYLARIEVATDPSKAGSITKRETL